MSLLKVIEDAPGYVKATLQGPQGSGKTRTAVELACKTREYFGSHKPIAFFDTETGSDYVAHLITERTGVKPLRVKTRAFTDLRQVVQECVNGAADILIVDSITHVWREHQAAYMAKINEGRRNPKVRMDIQDIMKIKELWAPWPDDFLLTPLHIIVCGREGNEWGHEFNEETGKSELVQVGKKMKVESEFGYEASLMIAMHAEQVQAVTVKKRGGAKEKQSRRIINIATVLKDRFDVINGNVIEMPMGESFVPFLKMLKPGAHGSVDTTVKSNATMPPLSEDGWTQEKKDRTILCEEIQGELLKHYPGQTAKEKAAKAALIEKAFNTRSWTKVEGMRSETLRRGLDVIKTMLTDRAAFEASIGIGAIAA
jgi:hypothetical protein